MMTRLALLTLIVALLWPCHSPAVTNGFTSAAFYADPADCLVSDGDPGEACEDSTIGAKLSEFLYWEYRASVAGGGNHLFLGVAGGFLWSISCDHCGISAATANFPIGQWSGQTFDSVNFTDTGTGAYRQFNTTGNVLKGGGSRGYGDILYRYVAQGGDAMPDIPMIPVVQNITDLAEGTLLLSMSGAVNSVDTVLGWFGACATTVAGGGGGTLPTCCETEREPGKYDGAATTGSLTVPPITVSAVNPVSYGGEGIYATCILDPVAGPTYIGPVYRTSGAYAWGTWEYHRADQFDGNKSNDDGITGIWNISQPAFENDSGVGFPPRPATGTSAFDKGRCFTTATQTEAGGLFYNEWVSPTTWQRTHISCYYSQFDGGNVVFPVSDSGAPTFAYIDSRPAGDRWVYVSSGAHTVTKDLLTLQQRSLFHEWVYGTPAGGNVCWY